ncbi:uncharacterized protein Dwil_GK26854 [Drosophila willistoni]|uniref:Uncharacterized protein n=1 Tax=Drosophila willistoni TaxID=7260 RepID=A0A0Q9X4C4_DROWI|nr:uncharacterized protein Dwil_GK26854 [Drosophila willistoni]
MDLVIEDPKEPYEEGVYVQESSVPLNDKVEQEKEQIPRDLDKTPSDQEDTEKKWKRTTIANEVKLLPYIGGKDVNIEKIVKRDISIATIEDIKNHELEDEISTSETTSESENGENLTRLSFADTIFAALEDMPNVSELSLSVEEDEIERRSQSFISTKSVDTGHFVDPLTGESLHSSSETYIESLNEEVEQYIADDSDSYVTLSLSDLPMDDLPTPRRRTNNQSDEYDPNLLNFNLAQTVVRDYSSIPSGNLDVGQVSEQIVSDFLHILLKSVVNEADTAISKALLTQRLDIVKLYQELEKVVEQHLVEKYRNTALNLKTVEYCRRNNMLHHIEDRSFYTEIMNRHRYFQTLLRLDLLRKRVAETKIC